MCGGSDDTISSTMSGPGPADAIRRMAPTPFGSVVPTLSIVTVNPGAHRPIPTWSLNASHTVSIGTATVVCDVTCIAASLGGGFGLLEMCPVVRADHDQVRFSTVEQLDQPSVILPHHVPVE